MRKVIIVLLILTLAVPISLSAIDTDLYLENNETISISCQSTSGERYYNITNDDGQLIVEEIIEPDEPAPSWSNWSSWWVMYNAPELSHNVYWIHECFGGSIEVEPSDSTYTFELVTRWNTITAPKNIAVNDIIVIYRDTEYSWSEAYSFRIVYRYVFTIDHVRVSYFMKEHNTKFMLIENVQL